ncbi:MAG: MiaB/RimO family radical SAM methylthiotransferase, partial [Deltaproteobacteria bacterium]|nr:MiaB/RimO family radical SAM methylthiotransferase [Deltaproteobacteria bacterium]
FHISPRWGFDPSDIGCGDREDQIIHSDCVRRGVPRQAHPDEAISANPLHYGKSRGPVFFMSLPPHWGSIRVVKRVWIHTLGCKVNLADSAEVVQRLDPAEFEIVSRPERAELGLLQTCAVTHKADRDVRKILGRLHRTCPDLSIVVAGCGAVLHADRLARAFPSLYLIVPEAGQPERCAVALGGAIRRLPSGPEAFWRLGRVRAFVKVQDGCDSRCSYCVIPHLRGRSRSLPPTEVRDRVDAYLSRGHLEVVLTGIHLGRYGQDLEDRCDLATLIELLSPVFEMNPAARLRLSSIEPLEWSESLIEAIAAREWICRHFHVPLQSGDDGLLAGMGRPYCAAQYEAVIHGLAERFPHSAIGADVLVGHPGEGEQQAARTHQLILSLPLSYLHVFTFSPRPRTRAAALERPASGRVRDRARLLRAAGQQKWIGFLRTMLDREHRLLVEVCRNGYVEGRIGSYARMRARTARQSRPGQMHAVVAEKLAGTTLEGVISPEELRARS